MKKQVKKLSKKILVLGLATSLIFTTCFSYKKINAHATSVAVGLGAYTLYEICLYVGGLALATFGAGVVYENRDDIAEFGKSVIDNISDLSSSGWIMGSHTTDGDYVYGTEALQEVKDTQWTVIQGGGQSPKNDNDDDGDEDADDRNLELNLNGYFLTQAGLNYFENKLKPMYENWKNENSTMETSKEATFMDKVLGFFNAPRLDDLDSRPVENTYYYARAIGYIVTYDSSFDEVIGYRSVLFQGRVRETTCDGHFAGLLDPTTSNSLKVYYRNPSQNRVYSVSLSKVSEDSLATSELYMDWNSPSSKYYFDLQTDMPLFSTYGDLENYLLNGDLSKAYFKNTGVQGSHVADWIKEDDDWKGHLEDLATSLRSLQDLIAISQQLANNVSTTQPSADAYGDLMDNLGNQYAPKTDPISNPTYYPSSNTTPQLDPSEFPNYVPSDTPDPTPDIPDTPVVPDTPDSPSGDGTEEVPEIDLDGLLSIFNILFYLIMIIVMLIYLFLSCLAFIVMIFRIPASSSMLPEDMVLGYEHLKTIMIPNTNISIYGFAMALIYLFIIFAVIKLIRLEINDFKFPRSYK